MKVLVLCEDPTHDQFIAKPVVQQALSDAGRPRARVDVLRDPHLRGADQVLERASLAEIIADNAMVDVFVLVVDRDCDRQNNATRAADRAAEHERLVACVAIEEIEVWMLALHAGRLGVPWRDIREECDAKETFAEPFLRRSGFRGPGHGRKAAMRQLGARWRDLKRRRCPELQALVDELRRRLG